MRLIPCPHELSADPYAFGSAPHAALDHVIDVHLAGDLRGIFASAFVVHGRGSGNHLKLLRRKTGQLCDQFFGHSVGEILLRGIAAEVLERQHQKSHLPCAFVSAGRRRIELADEAIPHRWQCVDETGALRGIRKSIPQPMDGAVDAVVELEESGFRPQSPAQFLASHDLARAFEERDQ